MSAVFYCEILVDNEEEDFKKAMVKK